PPGYSTCWQSRSGRARHTLFFRRQGLEDRLPPLLDTHPGSHISWLGCAGWSGNLGAVRPNSCESVPASARKWAGPAHNHPTPCTETRPEIENSPSPNAHLRESSSESPAPSLPVAAPGGDGLDQPVALPQNAALPPSTACDSRPTSSPI